MTDLQVVDVSNQFLRNVNFRVQKGGFFSIVGPSGAGKSSLLRAVAGLTRHDGKIFMNGDEVQKTPPSRRAVGWVSQDLYLFPHLTLEGNLVLAMKRTRHKADHKRRKALEMLELLKIGHLAKRKPDTLSGGEKQRAALARVLVSMPRLVLLDEPFSKLDFRTARYLRTEFKSLQKKLDLTTIIVTHDIEEASFFSDQLGVMTAGCLEIAENRNLQENNPGCGGFLETLNLIPCRLERPLDYGLVELSWAGGCIFYPEDKRSLSRLAIKPGDVLIGSTPPSGPDINRFTGCVKTIKYRDDSVHVVLDVNGFLMHAEYSTGQWEKRKVIPGQRIHGLLRMNDLEAVY